ncbi:hypothetical protein [Halobaculum rubrum]|uniref:hypothetical protein n=1 Tax=Halobaculum rubrum TaxID=2872158 RepID=UPI001CA44F5C|nr:hypothetical protein [Halobaculum rubrum]QZX98372.1 hypothetical protein K6T25_08700 [Halobaculum rubrum]
MPSTTHASGSLARQTGFALAAALVAAVVATAPGLVPTVVGITADTVWLVSAAGAVSTLVAVVIAGVAGAAAGMPEASEAALARTTAVFAVVSVVAFSAATVLFGLFVPGGSVGPPLVAVAGVAERTVPFVAGGVAGAALSLARGASYSATDPN